MCTRFHLNHMFIILTFYKFQKSWRMKFSLFPLAWLVGASSQIVFSLQPPYLDFSLAWYQTHDSITTSKIQHLFSVHNVLTKMNYYYVYFIFKHYQFSLLFMSSIGKTIKLVQIEIHNTTRNEQCLNTKWFWEFPLVWDHWIISTQLTSS